MTFLKMTSFFRDGERAAWLGLQASAAPGGQAGFWWLKGFAFGLAAKA